MTTDEVIAVIKDAVSKHEGDKYELYDALTDEFDHWVDEYEELQNEQEDDEEEADDGPKLEEVT